MFPNITMKIISIIHLLSILLFINHVGGYILPGMTPTDYEKGEEVDLKVNKLTSVHTQLPYDYYSLKFCKPDDGVKPYAENLGELLSGDRIEMLGPEIIASSGKISVGNVLLTCKSENIMNPAG